MQDEGGFNFRSVTLALIVMNAVFFFADMLYPSIGNAMAFTPASAFSEPWTFVTSLFAHADLAHIFFNMFTLFMFGELLERRLGSVAFLVFYIAAGVSGNLLQMGMAYSGLFPSHMPGVPPEMIPGIGASGAIMGILGVLGVIAPRIQMMVPLIPVMVPMWVGVIIFALFNIGLSFAATNIGTGAHLGGLTTGVMFGFALKLAYERSRKSTRLVYVWE